MTAASRFNLPIPFGWFTVALSNELAVGEVKPLQYFDQELVLFRTESGEAKVIQAICPHLGAHIGYGGSVKGESVACPFHGWEFNGNGVCTSVPYAKNMPPKIKDKECIPPLLTKELNGAIYVWYHPKGEQPSFDVEVIPETIDENWQFKSMQDWIIEAPAQETNENAVDKAHFVYVHGTDGMPEAEVTVTDHRRSTKLVTELPAFGDDGTPTDDGSMAEIRLDSSSVGPGLSYQRFEGIFETVLLGLITPINADSVHLRFVYYQPKVTTDLQALMADGFIAENCRQVEQDMPIWQHKHYNPNPVLCDGDGPIAHYRKWFSQFYAEPLNH